MVLKLKAEVKAMEEEGTTCVARPMAPCYRYAATIRRHEIDSSYMHSYIALKNSLRLLKTLTPRHPGGFITCYTIHTGSIYRESNHSQPWSILLGSPLCAQRLYCYLHH